MLDSPTSPRTIPLSDGTSASPSCCLDANGVAWSAPDIEQDAGTVERIAAGTADRPEVLAWIERRDALSDNSGAGLIR